MRKVQLTLIRSPRTRFPNDNSETVRDKMSVLITNRKYVAYGLSTDTVLDDIERRNSPDFAFFTEFDSFAGQLRHSR